MTNPQKENGFTPIANELLEALAKYRIPGEQRQCLDVILRKTYGFNKKQDAISLSQFVEMTGINRQNVIRAIKGLLSKKIIRVIKKDNKLSHIYEFNKYYNQWQSLSKKITLSKKIMNVIKKDNLSLSKKIHTKDTITKDTITKDTILEYSVPSRELPDWLPLELWNEFKKYRIKIKKPLTEYAEKLNIKKLEKLKEQGNDPIKVIEETIMRSWQGFFPLKNENQIAIKPQTYAQAQDAERRERSKWLLQEMKNEKTNKQTNNDGIVKVIHQLPES